MNNYKSDNYKTDITDSNIEYPRLKPKSLTENILSKYYEELEILIKSDKPNKPDKSDKSDKPDNELKLKDIKNLLASIEHITNE